VILSQGCGCRAVVGGGGGGGGRWGCGYTTVQTLVHPDLCCRVVIRAIGAGMRCQAAVGCRP
jgi:hypothetical protein